MVLHSCFHSRYIAMLFFFFSQRPSGSAKAPSDPVSAVSSQISHSAADGGQPMSLTPHTFLLITPHLISQGRPACSLLPQQYCRGKSFAHSQIQILWGNFLDGCAVELTSEVSFAVPLVFQRYVVILALYIPGRSISSCVRSWLPWIVYLLWLC